MKKLFMILLSALLLWGLLALGPDPRGSAAAEAQRLPVSVTLISDKSAAPVEQALQPLSLKKQKNTEWADGAGIRLVIYGDGAYLFTVNQVYALQERGDGFELMLSLYAAPYDEAPAMTLSAGTVRVLLDGEAVKLEVADDPLGLLAFSALDGATLTKERYKPYRYPSFNFMSLPREPGTEWFCYGNMGEHRYAILETAIGEDCAMTGTLSLPGGRTMSCALLGNEDGFALVDTAGDAPELLFYGERNRAAEEYYLADRYQLVRIDLAPVYDPLGLCAEGGFEIWRDEKGETDPRYMLGMTLDILILDMMGQGWTDATEQIGELHPILEGWYARLVKDGQTLLIHYELDPYPPYDQYQPYPDAYVLYGADGTVLCWAGEKPLDHAAADGYKLKKGVYFHVEIGAWGMEVGEDEYVYFLDDGRIAIEYVPHESGDGDLDFEIVRVIP